MAPPGYTITIPKGDPDDLLIVVRNLRKIAGDADGHGGILAGEAKGMHSATWKDNAGAAAEAEASALSTACKDAGKHLGTGATALSAYAKVLDTAKTKIKALDAESDGIPAEARTEAGKNPMYHHVPPQDQKDWVDGIISDKMQPIMKKVHHWEHELDQAAKTCAGKLNQAIGYHKGQSSADVYNQTYNGMLHHLPTMAAYQAHQDAKTLARDLHDGKKPSKDLLARMKAEAGDEFYSAAFANELKAKGIERIPPEIARSDLDQETRKELMTTIATITATATDGKGPELDRKDRDQLVSDLSNNKVIFDDNGMSYRPAWAMSEILGYGTGKWGDQMLADMATNIYDHGGLDTYGGPNMAANAERPISDADNKYLLTDSMGVALTALDKNANASRIFLDHHANGDLDRLRSLLMRYRTGVGSQVDPTHQAGQEKVLLDVIKNASLTFGSQEAQLGPQGDKAADIASYFLHDEADMGNRFGLLNKDVQHTVTSVLSGYYDDVHHRLVLGTTADSTHPGTGHGYADSPFPKDMAHMQISNSDLKSLIGDVYGEQDNRRQLFHAAAIYGEAKLQQDIDAGRVHPDKAPDYTATGDMGIYGADAHAIMDIGNKRINDDAKSAQATLDFLNAGADVAGTLAGPEGKVAEKALSTTLTIAHTGSGFLDPQGHAQDLINQIGDNQDDKYRSQVVEMVVRNHLWTDGADDPRKLGFWDAQHQRLTIPKGHEAEFKEWIHDRAEHDPTVQEAMNTLVRRSGHG